MRRAALWAGALVIACAGVLWFALSGLAAGPAINRTPYVYLSIGDQSAVEGQTVPMTIRSSVAVSFPIEVYWETADGSALRPGDYSSQSGEAVIPAGKTSTTCPVGSRQDTIHEHPETFQVHIWSDNHAVRYTDANAVFTITDDDPVPTVQIADAPTITEGGNLVFPLTLANPTADTVTVNIDPAANVGLDLEAGNTSLNWDANDYTGTAPTSVTFAPLQTAAQYTFHTINDGVFESTEQVSLQLTDTTNAQLPQADQRSALGVVDDNTPMPILSIESPGTVMWWQPMNFPITLSGPTQLRVHLSVDSVIANWRGENCTEGNCWTYDYNFGFELAPMQTSADLLNWPAEDPSVSTSVNVWSVAYSFMQNDEYGTPIPGGTVSAWGFRAGQPQ